MGKDVIKEAITEYQERIEGLKFKMAYARQWGVNAEKERQLLCAFAEFVKVLEKIEKEM